MNLEEEEFKMVFTSLIKNVGKEFMGIVFNFCLLLTNVRKTILLESSNNLFKDYEFSKFFNYLRPIINKYNLKTYEDVSIPLRIYIYTADINECKINNKLKTDYEIGSILEYSCPGLMDGTNIVHYLIENNSIFSEICCSPVPITIYTKFDKLKKIGKILSLNISIKIIKRVSVRLTQEFIKNRNFAEILKYKENIANIFYNESFNRTGDAVYNLKNINETKKLILYDQKLILLVLNYIQNNPCQHLYGKIEKDLWILYEEKIEKIEKGMYNIMKGN